MVEIGAREAILTLPTGCVALVGNEHERRLYRASVDPGVVDARSRVGSGDAFLAGYVASRYIGRPPEDCVRFAVACGAESVQHFGAGVLDAAGVERLTQQVSVEALSDQALHASG
jgi:1-phosphofructokinase/tagatose 6-phosphate kinase